MKQLLHDFSANFGWRALIDVVLLSLVVFRIYLWFRDTVAVHVGIGLLLVGGGAILANQAGLLLTTFALQLVSALGVLLIFSLFRPEIRQAMQGISPLRWLRRRLFGGSSKETDDAYRGLSEGLARLADKRIGALVVLPRGDPIDEQLSGGKRIEAAVDPSLLEAIFQTSSPLHDGAMVVRRGWIEHAGAVLPLSEGDALEEKHGTRHRAAVGMSEACDALVLVVSEERGEVALASGGGLEVAPADADALHARIRAQMARSPESVRPPNRRGSAGPLRRYGGAALAFVVILVVVLGAWFAILGDRTAVRIRHLDVELRGVPERIEVKVIRPKDGRVRVRVRGPSRLLTPEKLREVGVWLDVGKDPKLGWRRLEVRATAPTGLEIDGVQPDKILVRIRKKPEPKKKKKKKKGD